MLSSRISHARQLWHWLYHQGVTDPAVMTTLPKGLRERVAERYRNDRLRVVAAQLSADGTRKWLLRLTDGREVETVYIPEPDRGALCISTQVGCSLTCSFCHTGTMPLVRNIVVMGMGEPLLNYEQTARALRVAMDADGLAFPRRKITLSTSGVVPKIEACDRELGVALEVSLHAVRDELRDELVPINRKWNIASLLDACRAYAAQSDRTITFEYVMLDGINDSEADARELVRLIRGIPAKINLIPFNPWPGAPYCCSPPERIAAFAAIVRRAGYPAPVRTPRGRDILAACGQLKTASERRRSNSIAA